MKPSPCCFVLYHFLDSQGYGRESALIHRPALVTSIDTDDPEGMTVNLHVFFEPNDVEVSPRFGNLIDMEETGPHRAGVEPCHADPFRPATPQTWSWPPRT